MKKFNLRAAVPGYFSTLQFLKFSFTEKGSIVMAIRKVIFLFILFTGLLFLSCNPSEPENKPTGVEFTAEDASCTEPWLTLKAEGIAGAEVYRGDSLIFNFAGQSIDTTIYDEGLLPNKSYNYNLTIRELNNKTLTRSAAVKTMDTTSHNFTWQTFTFGEHGSSVLYDVAIINENNMWAVGEIYIKDSLGNPDPHAYNAVHWDGVKWEVKRIYFPTVCGQTSVTPYPAGAIFNFDDGEIWVTSTGDKIARLKNNVQVDKFCLPSSLGMSINKLWGSSSSDMYAVGDNGNIAHYDGSNWTKIKSGTDTNINDVFGIRDNQNRTVIYCPVSSFWVAGDKKILKIIDGKTDSVRWHKENRLSSCWALNEHFL
ncbi:MAG: hypothetical protein K8H86_05895, partial [Ignavibacteriaceae bacterium]|nr:hypothetical protein [Ignavibacteriaceae bacterium]